MGRQRGKIERVHKGVCAYCGAGVGDGHKMCGNCIMKLKLFREIKSKVKEICERERKYGS